MRIAQIAPLTESVPPHLYGGTERVVSWLTEELVARGQDVTLFATGDSQTRASLAAVWPRSLRLGRSRVDPIVAHTVLLQQLAARVTEFDIIHCHTDWLHLPLLSISGVPFLTTLHGRLDLAGLPTLARAFPTAPFVSISDSQRRPLPEVNWIGTVHHGMPQDLLQVCYEPEGYLAFLGRLSPEKGADIAIRLAQRAGMSLRISAKVPRDASVYINEKIKPHLDGRQIVFVGETRDDQKAEFLGNAAALLFPIDWPEPFGLVMIEAMACGTPVIAYRRGSVPEVVQDGVSGFIVDNEEQALDALGKIRELDRGGVRQAFERRFTAARMTEDYLRIYRDVMGGAGLRLAVNDELRDTGGRIEAYGSAAG